MAEAVIQREVSEAGGQIRATFKVYPPSPTVWMWLTFPRDDLTYQYEGRSTVCLRAAILANGWPGVKRVFGGGVVQDFRAAMLLALSEIEREWLEHGTAQ